MFLILFFPPPPLPISPSLPLSLSPSLIPLLFLPPPLRPSPPLFSPPLPSPPLPPPYFSPHSNSSPPSRFFSPPVSSQLHCSLSLPPFLQSLSKNMSKGIEGMSLINRRVDDMRADIDTLCGPHVVNETFPNITLFNCRSEVRAACDLPADVDSCNTTYVTRNASVSCCVLRKCIPMYTPLPLFPTTRGWQIGYLLFHANIRAFSYYSKINLAKKIHSSDCYIAL